MLFYHLKFNFKVVFHIRKYSKTGYKLLKINDLIEKSKNGTETIISSVPLNKMQNTRQGI